MNSSFSERGISASNSNFVSLIEKRAQAQPDKICFTFLTDKDKQDTLSYSELYLRSRIIASCLQSLSLKGERVLLLYTSGLEYISAFFGCLFASAIAVPAYPPSLAGNSGTMRRIELIIKDAGIKVILTTSKILEMLAAQRTSSSVQASDFHKSSNSKTESSLFNLHLKWIATDNLDKELSSMWICPEISGNQTAFLQYTSGSTGDPKGVMVSHTNLIHNSELIKRSFAIDPETYESVIWLPFYHDMGLIGGILQPVYSGIHCTLFPSLTFLAWPLKWLQIISSRRGKNIISGGPNFAYDLCTKRITDAQAENLDLSGWTCAFSGSEPVRYNTIEDFTSKFSKCGFRKEAFFPCYGMAEATLFVSAGLPGTAPVISSYTQQSLLGINPQRTAEDSDRSINLVSSGVSGFDIKIADPELHTSCQQGQIGEIWIKGESVASGYWNKEELTCKIFKAYTADTNEGPFLRTGDLGFIDDGELYVTGRLKDLIIIRGSNYYPQDLEFAAELSHTALRKGYGAAFSVDIEGEEKLIVAFEVQNDRNNKYEEIAANIRNSISTEFELQVYSILLLKAKSIPKTSSGKIQRKETRNSYLAGTLSIIYESCIDTPVFGREKEQDHSSDDEQPITAQKSHTVESIEEWLINYLNTSVRGFSGRISHRSSLPKLGLDSLMAASLKASIDNEFGISLSFSDLFKEENIGHLAEKIFSCINSEKRPEPSSSQLMPGEEEFMLLPGQKSLWFMHLLAPGSPAYNVFYAVKTADLDVSLMKKTIHLLIRRHSQLRSRFFIKEGQPWQKITDSSVEVISEFDARNISESELYNIVSEDAHTPFDLLNGGVFRCSIYIQANNRAVILFNFHHIAVDMWSVMVLMKDLRDIYTALSENRDPSLKPVLSGYSKYASKYTEELKSRKAELHLEYWKEKLSGELQVLDLPFDFQRPLNKSYCGRTFNFNIPAEITSALKELSRHQGITIYSLLVSAYLILLHKYSGQSDIIIGTPASGRTDPRFSDTVGYFVNPLPLRSRLVKGITLKNFLSRTQNSVWELLDHQDYPLQLIIENIQPRRDPGRTPLFDVMFTLERPQNLEEDGISSFVLSDNGAKTQFGTLLLESFSVSQKFAQFDIGLFAVELADTISASIQFNTDLFTESTIETFSSRYIKVLTEIISNINQPVSRINMIPEGELISAAGEKLIDQKFDPDMRCYDLFEKAALLNPQKTALSFQNKEITFSELLTLSRQIARALNEKGVKPESPVGVFMEQSPDLIAAMLGIFKSGGVYLPLNTAYPDEHLNYMIRDAEISCIISCRDSSGRLKDSGVSILLVEDLNTADADNTFFSHAPDLHGENAAYIIYTSGSTGTPKGVVIPHNALADHILQMAAFYGYKPDDRILWFASQSFDASIEQILTPLICGASVVIRDKELWDWREFINKINGNNLTMINLPPAYFHQLVTDWEANNSDFPTQKLRLAIIGGDVFPAEDFLLWQKVCRGTVRTINAYGPTETVITSAAFDIPCSYIKSKTRSVVPVGKPLGHRHAFIYDKDENILPFGIAGELHFGGECLARGYLKNPALTAERFVPDSSDSSRPGSRMYRTGDVAKYSGAGILEFHGRADKQVKIRGFRIEPGEIESVLKNHPAVRQAAVIASSGLNNEKYLNAYVELGGVQDATVQALFAFLREKLPDYMVPANIMILDSIPLTAGGKIDLRSLPVPEPQSAQDTMHDNASASETEKRVAQIIAEVLGRAKIGIHENFFELGGHSLLAARVISRIKEIYNINMPLSAFIEHANAAGIAAKIDKLIRENMDEVTFDFMLSEIENDNGTNEKDMNT
ncbi:MAG: amino acid adenylation domain-containing protein [Syntrophothermus sp.]